MDAIEEWNRAQQRVIDLVADLPPERAELRVPACPDWTVRGDVTPYLDAFAMLGPLPTADLSG